MSERDAKIVELYQAGWMLKNIAAEIGMAPHSIGFILKRLGFERPAKPQKRPCGRPDYTADIKALWEQGLCATQIAERLNINPSGVRQTLWRLKLTSRENMRTRYDASAGGGSGRSGFAGNMARRT